MDSIRASEAPDAGSIPAEATSKLSDSSRKDITKKMANFQTIAIICGKTSEN